MIRINHLKTKYTWQLIIRYSIMINQLSAHFLRVIKLTTLLLVSFHLFNPLLLSKAKR